MNVRRAVLRPSRRLLQRRRGRWGVLGPLMILVADGRLRRRGRPATAGWPLSLAAALLLGGAPLPAASAVAAPAPNTWSPAAPMTTARAGHTATLLPSGKVLVVGGCCYMSGDDRAELYDPRADAWSAAGRLHTVRTGDTATLLPDGQVLVTGGQGVCTRSSCVPGLASAELYDPASGRWTASGRLRAARAFHTATLLPNGRVLIAGGVTYCPPCSLWPAGQRRAVRSARWLLDADRSDAHRPLQPHRDAAG